MLLASKRLKLNSTQPDGMWWIFVTHVLYSIGVVAVTFTYEDFIITASKNLDQAHTYTIIASIFLINFSGIIGGFLSQVIGYKRALIIGIIYTAISIYIITISNLAILAFFGFIVGVGITIPNLYTALSMLYTQDDPRRHSGFTLVYLSSILGGFIALIILKALLHKVSYSQLYLIIGTITLFSGLSLLYVSNEIKTNISIAEVHDKSYERVFSIYGVIAVLIVLTVLFRDLMYSYTALVSVIGVVSIGVIGILVYLIAWHKQVKTYSQLFALVALLLCGMVYWFALYSALIILVDHQSLFDDVYKHLAFHLLSEDITMQINTVSMLFFGFLLAYFWNKHKSKPKIRTIALLFAISLALAGLSSIFFVMTIYTSGQNWFIVSSVMLVIAVLFSSLGQMIISPIYFALVAKLVPRNYESLAMGIFFVLISLMGLLAYMYNHHQARVLSKILNYSEVMGNYLYIPVLLFVTATVAYGLSRFKLKDFKN